MFSNNLLAGVSGQGGEYTIDNSLRFNDDDSAYLSRTPSVAGNRRTWTFSAWVKLGNSGATRTLFAARLATSNSDSLQVYVTSNDQINVGGVSYGITATPVLRDPSGWYHIVLSYDTTQATDTNRAKIYINGIQASVTGTYPSINLDTPINNTQAHNLGRRPTENDRYFDGYMAEVNFIDGQALTADDFGQIDETTGEWSPKKYSGTYGTNGFYLPFNGNANDDSGNGNNWTENNLASTDYMIDTPTNNFSVLQNSPLGTGVSYQEGNLEFNNATFNTAQSGSTIRFASGTWYCEVTPTLNGNIGWYGVRNPETNDYWIYYGFSGNKFSYISGTLTESAYGSAYTVGDVVGISYNADTGDLQFYKNNVAQGVIATGFAGQELDFYFADGSSDTAHNGVVNFGADSSFAGVKTRQGNTDANGIGDFYYTPPTGYLALCTDNLPEPTIVDSESHFNVVTYTGTGTTLNVTGVGFQPDLVWMKRRDSANSHDLIDVVRGDTARLFPNLTDAELSDVTFSFDSDGFSPDPTKANENAAGGSYVAWCWKAGGTAVSNTDGSITSQVSANVDAGFSIVSWTSDGSSSNGVGHGLSEAPTFFIYKTRNSVAPWYVWTTLIDGSNDQLLLNDTNSKGDIVGYGSPSSTTISNYGFGSGVELIAYCFHSVEGFSKFGSYVGNGSADGPFIYTGFRPAFVMIKNTQNGATSWVIADSKRNTFNEVDLWLQPNTSGAESDLGTTYDIDFLSNGFKIRESANFLNQSTYTLIYMAFAESPTKFSLGR